MMCRRRLFVVLSLFHVDFALAHVTPETVCGKVHVNAMRRISLRTMQTEAQMKTRCRRSLLTLPYVPSMKPTRRKITVTRYRRQVQVEIHVRKF